MIDQLAPLAQLLRQLQQVPYLASKNLYKVANYFLVSDTRKIEQLCKALLEIKSGLDICSLCCVWKERDKECIICSSPKRNQALICIVENWQDLLAIEKAGGYTGVYHVLGGLLSPLEGIGPEQLSVEKLCLRVQKKSVEIILALNQTPEGEATAAYVGSKLANEQVVLSCIARGVPVGSSLESMDRLTVYKALLERRPF